VNQWDIFQRRGFQFVFLSVFFNNNKATYGGAIYMYYWNDAFLNVCTFTDNYASAHGGAIYVEGGGITLSSNIITNNQAGGDGGGIYILNGEEISLLDTRIEENQAARGGGLALILPKGDSSIMMNIKILNIERNRASFGGGMLVHINKENIVEIQDFSLTDNVAHVGGGALYWPSSDPNFDGLLKLSANMTLKNNSATYGKSFASGKL
jgi:predicted outer membrane repeat protein